jgi:hypothetical protein
MATFEEFVKKSEKAYPQIHLFYYSPLTWFRRNTPNAKKDASI